MNIIKPLTTKSYNSRNSTKTVVSKLRRLKIEENLLIQYLLKSDGKIFGNVNEDSNDRDRGHNFDNENDYKNTVKRVKDSYTNIKNVFDEVRTVSQTQELLAELELDEIKSRVLELETALKCYKKELGFELSQLRRSEQEILKQIDDIDSRETIYIKKRQKQNSGKHNQIVPSPVKLLMTSPFKNYDVQEFHNFMKNSPNRYGGWNEYNHIIFLKYWHKYFSDTDVCSADLGVEALIYENFVDEVLMKLHGVNKSSLISHIKWYQKYTELKQKQQKAINKWKSSKKVITNLPSNNKISKPDSQHQCLKNTADFDDLEGYSQIACDVIAISEREIYNSERSHDINVTKKVRIKKRSKSLVVKDGIPSHLKHTKQSLYRNFTDEGTKIDRKIFSIEDIEKLATPTWRAHPRIQHCESY